jgi:hypothetical protein
MFGAARRRGTAQRIGQLNPMGRYGVAEGTVFAARSPVGWQKPTRVSKRRGVCGEALFTFCQCSGGLCMSLLRLLTSLFHAVDDGTSPLNHGRYLRWMNCCLQPAFLLRFLNLKKYVNPYFWQYLPDDDSSLRYLDCQCGSLPRVGWANCVYMHDS